MSAEKATSAAFAIMVEALLFKNPTVGGIIKLTGLHENTVRKYLRALHNRDCARIVDYEFNMKSNRFDAPKWSMQSGAHAKRKVLTRSQRQAFQNARQRALYQAEKQSAGLPYKPIKPAIRLDRLLAKRIENAL
jgi:hypothetical protein